MNDFSEIEVELRKLRPLPFRAELLSRIDKSLAFESSNAARAAVLRKRRSTRTNWISLGLGLGLAGAALFLMLARVNEVRQPGSEPKNVTVTKPVISSPGKSSSSQFLPAGVTEVVYNA